MYTREELAQIDRLLAKRRWIVALPTALLLVAAVAMFVYGQMARSERLWLVAALFTVVGGAYCLFLHGTYVRPVRQYRAHAAFMLTGRKSETTGIFKSFDSRVCERCGVDCHALLVNVGQRDDPEDDRLFYYDALKPAPDIAPGARVTIVSGDRMIFSLATAQ